MKLAILGTRGIPARYGGFETFAEELAVRLVRSGVEVTVYCESAGGAEPESYKGVRLKYITSPKIGPLTPIFFDTRCLIDARKKFDVVYLLGYGVSAFCFIPRIYGSSVWINMDGIEWGRAKWGLAARIYIKSMEAVAMYTPNRIIADAQGIKDFLERRYRRVPPCDVIAYGAHVFENVPQDMVLSDMGLTIGEYYLVVCRLEPENHLLEIIEGFNASGSALPLVIVGNHNIDTAYIRKLKAVSGKGVKFVGAVYDQTKLKALRYYCKAYFHGHSVGGTNPSLLEALGCGNLLIAHDNPFNREVAGDCGLYFKSPEDIPALISRVEGLSNDRRSELSAKARRIIKERYDWDAIADTYLKLLNSLPRKQV